MTRAKKEAAGTAPAATTEGTSAPAPAATAQGGEGGETAATLPGSGEASDDQQLEAQGPFVAVRSASSKGRWRIGRFFTSEPQRIPLADLSDEEKERLASDPELICQLIDED